MVQFAIGKQEFIVGCQCRSHDLVHFYPWLLCLLLDLFSLFITLLTFRLPFLILITVFFVLPFFITSVFLSLSLLIIDQHLHFLVLDSGNRSFLFLQFFLEETCEVIILLVLLEAFLGLHDAMPTIGHMLADCICTLEILGLLVLAGDAHIAYLDLLLQVFDESFGFLAELPLGNEE